MYKYNYYFLLDTKEETTKVKFVNSLDAKLLRNAFLTRVIMDDKFNCL